MEPSLSFKSRCINTGILMIRSIKHFEKRSWGKDVDHTCYFFHDLWFGDINLLQVR